MSLARRFLRSRLVWRGAVIVALFVALQSLLYAERQLLIEQESRFGYAILDNAWSISELLNETKNTNARLRSYAAGSDDLAEVQLAYELLWSRIAALSFADRVEFEGLAPLVADYIAVLERHDLAVFGATPLDPEAAAPMVEELATLASRTRQLWSVQFNQNRSQFLDLLSGQVSGAAHGVDALMALVALAGLAYLGFELLVTQLALRREQALAAEARSASEMKTTFLANMSHEVRTPLSGVIGATELLAASALDRDQRHLVETVATSAEHLLGVVNQVLDISKIEAGKVEIEDGIVDLHGMLRVVLAMFGKAARDKGVALRMDLGEDVPTHVRGDALRLRQVLANLVSNAVKFTEAGYVVASVTVAPDTGRGRRLIVGVEDTGIGISRAAMSRIFDAFAQSDVSDTRRFGGTGLGLTIARHLTDLMDGRLDLASQPGKGTRATVDLPLRPVTLFGTAPAADSGPPTEDPAPLTVLIADDNATNRLLLSRLLAPLVREVRQVEDGAGALAAWRRGGIDLVLLDIQMPGMTGVEAACEIRAAERAMGWSPVPIYSISANAMPHQIEVYAAAGMNGHLSKPFRKADLAAVVARHRPAGRGPLAA